MKFAKQLLQAVSRFRTEEYKCNTIPYKAWKKNGFTAQLSQGKAEPANVLIERCSHIDRLFRRHWRAATAVAPRAALAARASCVLPCLLGSVHPSEIAEKRSVDEQELLEFAAINRAAVYKICKKWAKRGVAPPELYQHMRTQGFAFMGSGELTKLQFVALAHREGPEAAAEECECPICLEPPSKLTIMTCGHWLCWDCLNDMTRIDHLRGTLTNRLRSVSLKMRCPLCRARDPFRDIGAAGVLDLTSRSRDREWEKNNPKVCR